MSDSKDTVIERPASACRIDSFDDIRLHYVDSLIPVEDATLDHADMRSESTIAPTPNTPDDLIGHESTQQSSLRPNPRPENRRLPVELPASSTFKSPIRSSLL